MAMKVLALCSQKGGVGKTTICGHLSVEAERTGFGPVALIDTDPQGSLASWWNERQAAEPQFAKVDITKLAEHLKQLDEAGFALAVIDTPPAVTAMIEQVMRVADLILIPTRPSPHDLRAVGSTVEIAERCGKRMVFVVNGAAQRARITGEAAIALSQHGTVAPVTLYQRTDFASSMIDGRTVQELDPASKSAGEVAELWSYVDKQLRKA